MAVAKTHGWKEVIFVKKTVIFLSLFAFAFALSVSLTTFDKASAGDVCARNQCLCVRECTTETGPNCTDPAKPYYYVSTTCAPFPRWLDCSCQPFEDEFAGCCSDP